MASFFCQSEDEINLESFTKVSLLLFRLMCFTFNPIGTTATLFERRVYSAMSYFFKLIILSYAVAVFSMLKYTEVHSNNFVEASSVIPNAMCVFLGAMKSVSIVTRKEDIWMVMKDLTGILEDQKLQSFKFIVKKYSYNFDRFVKIYCGVTLAVLMQVVMPLATYLISGKMTMSVKYWFPFDGFQPGKFFLVLFWVDWIAVSGLILFLATDLLLYGLITVIIMEFDILKLHFENYKKDDQKIQLKRLVDHHNKLIDIANKVQDIFEINFLFIFTISAIIMCFVAFQLTTVGNYLFYVPYISMIVFQIFLLCWFGQKLNDSSDSIAEGIFNCGWEEFTDVHLKKDFCLIIIRARKPQRLTAMKFAVVSLPSFAAVSWLTKAF